MNRKKLLSLALAGTLSLTTLISPVLSVEASPSSVSEVDSLLSELEAEESAVSDQLEAIQSDIKNNEAEADELVAEMTETQGVLEELQTEIEGLKEVIQKRETQLKEQARSLQVVGETGNIISFILNAESLNEIVGRIDVVSTLISANEQTLAQQEEDKALVEDKEAETLEKQEEQNKIAAELEANKAALEEQKAEQESVLAEIASEKADAEDERQELVAQAEAAEERRASLAEARTASSNTDEQAVSTASSSSSQASSDVSNTTQASTSESTAAPAPSVSGGSVVGIAQGLIGVPYRYAGRTPAAFDCSGFTAYVFAQAGRSIPSTAASQYAATSRISRSQAQAGDLVFFSQGGGIDHVGIYLGGGNFIGSQTSTGVAIASIDSGYWSNYVAGFGR